MSWAGSRAASLTRSFGAVLAGSLLLAAATSVARAGDDSTARLRSMLAQGYEQAPSAADVATFGPGVDRALMEIYRDPSSPLLHRMRAMDLLAGFPSEELKTLLDTESARTDLPPALARRVLATAVQAFGEPEPAVAERVWQANSASADSTVRYDAAQMLGKLHPSAALLTVARQRATTETDASVKAELDRRIEAAAPR